MDCHAGQRDGRPCVEFTWEGNDECDPASAQPGGGVYRSDRMPAYATGGLAVRAADASLLATLDGRVTHGTFLNEATGRYPAAVLGDETARTLGIADLAGSPRIWLASGPSSCRVEATCGSGGRAGRWYTVIGILGPLELAPEVDCSALIGFPIAARDFGYDGLPSRVHVRAQTDRTTEVAGLLARAANPPHPEAVKVSRPSDALAARLAAANSTTALFLGLGAAATYALAHWTGWQPLIPPVAAGAGLATALAPGAIAGLYPAMRAAHLSPTDALRTA